MEQIPKIARQRLQVMARAGDHPDLNLLAAFAEKSLHGDEREGVLAHLAQCAECRDIVSLATPEEKLAQTAATPAHVSSGLFRWPVLRWGTLAACAVVVSAAVVLRYQKAGSRENTDAFVVSHEAPAVPAASFNKNIQPSEDSAHAKPIVAASVEKAKQDADAGFALKKGTEPSQQEDQKALSAPAPALVGGVSESLGVGSGAGMAPPATPQKTSNERARKEESRLVMAEQADQATALRAQTDTLDTSLAGSNDKTTAKVARGGPATKDAAAPAASQAEMKQNFATTPPFARRDAADFSSIMSLPRWTLSPEGKLQRSYDAGKSWQTIPLPSKATFRSLAAFGPQIWVGGSGGALYHSPDAGDHWTQVTPVANGKSLDADIISLEFTNVLAGKLATANRETWTTTDGGQSWQKK